MTHLDHPTQAAACGRNVHAVSADAFRKASDPCKACTRTLDAIDAGRAHYAGYDDGKGDTGARR